MSMPKPTTVPAPDLDLEKFPTEEEGRAKSLENSQTSSTEFNGPSSPITGKTTEEDALSRVESVASAFDPASRVPTNASRESGIVGIFPPPPLQKIEINRQVGMERMTLRIHGIGHYGGREL